MFCSLEKRPITPELKDTIADPTAFTGASTPIPLDDFGGVMFDHDRADTDLLHCVDRGADLKYWYRSM